MLCHKLAPHPRPSLSSYFNPLNKGSCETSKAAGSLLGLVVCHLQHMKISGEPLGLSYTQLSSRV